MIRFAILNEDNVVVNLAVGSEPLANNWIASDTALFRDIYVDGIFSTPEPDIDVDAQWAAIRTERNMLLAQYDWTQLPDAPVDRAAWATYRQELRDITDQADPFNIEWPVVPSTS